ncbi:hypothetical protein EKPJFOCH_0096 [Methylobacterium thuringiense]|uniref:Uncharacterized protein n=1 Tax=Methylobacterium thuringiense TaxID=1003091 RepID=A0ABQ4TIW7_9HYPH|nr:hypothetical protein EKPJFOCH_0096 [Methylobacterium thuringiense]
MRFSKYGWALCVMIATCVAVSAETAPPIADALANITVLVRPGRVGYVTVWDGNKYVQCRRVPDDSLHCEAGGVTMQPSLAAVLDPNRLQMLGNLGWSLDRSFGNYIRTFPAPMSYAVVAEQILEVLTRAYEANPTDLEINTDWIADIPCPPRNGPYRILPVPSTTPRPCAHSPFGPVSSKPSHLLSRRRRAKMCWRSMEGSSRPNFSASASMQSAGSIPSLMLGSDTYSARRNLRCAFCFARRNRLKAGRRLPSC